MAKELTFAGDRWRATHQATVNTVLGPRVRRKVISVGDQFLNRDHWTARKFVSGLCWWSQKHPGACPTQGVIRNWVRHANTVDSTEYSRKIIIAATPDELPRGLAMALVGGAYHEAWHTKYSRRTPLHFNEVYDRLMSLWGRSPTQGWGGLRDLLLTWSNVVEDIRIERIGCRQFPGAPSKMVELQDLILKMEEGRGPFSDLVIATAIFRDLGLGYKSARQERVLAAYQREYPEAWKFVTEGPLAPLLERSINLQEEDDLESLWIAMEIVAEISQEAQKSPPPPTPPELPTFSVGDRSTLQAGPHRGKDVEITWVGPKQPDGSQNLEYILVE